MQYYKHIEIDNFKSIQEKTLGFLKVYEIENRYGFHFLQEQLYTDYCPEILTAFDKFNIKPIAFGTYITCSQEQSQIHIDLKENFIKNFYKCRINIPILNCEGSRTEFYDASIDDFDAFTQQNGITYYSLKEGVATCKVDEVEIIRPTIIRVHMPHRVNVNLNTVPRICLTVKFDVDPVFLLNE